MVAGCVNQGIIAWPIAKVLEWILGPHHGIVYRRPELKELIAMHAVHGTYGGDLTSDTVNVVGTALDLQGKAVKEVSFPPSLISLVLAKHRPTRSPHLSIPFSCYLPNQKWTMDFSRRSVKPGTPEFLYMKNSTFPYRLSDHLDPSRDSERSEFWVYYWRNNVSYSTPEVGSLYFLFYFLTSSR